MDDIDYDIERLFTSTYEAGISNYMPRNNSKITDYFKKERNPNLDFLFQKKHSPFKIRKKIYKCAFCEEELNSNDTARTADHMWKCLNKEFEYPDDEKMVECAMCRKYYHIINLDRHSRKCLLKFMIQNGLRMFNKEHHSLEY